MIGCESDELLKQGAPLPRDSAGRYKGNTAPPAALLAQKGLSETNSRKQPAKEAADG